MELNFFEMILRTTGSFFAILLLARIIGKKQLSQLTFFHYVTGITIGSISAEIAAQAETPFWDGIVSLTWWSLLTILVTYLTLKSKKARILLDGKPTVIIKNGVILASALKKERLHIDELLMMLREKDIYSLDEVLHVTLETNGEIGVSKRPQFRNTVLKDLQKKAPESLYFPTELISNGKIIHENLSELGLSEEWLYKKLSENHISQLSDIYFAQILENGSLFICKN